MRGMTAKCSSTHPNLNKTKQDFRLFSLNSTETTELMLCLCLTCTSLNLETELSAHLPSRPCSPQGTSRAPELQRHWRHSEAGWGGLRSWPGTPLQHSGSLLGKLETAFHMFRNKYDETYTNWQMWNHLQWLTSDVARVNGLTRDGCSNWQHRRDAKPQHIHDWSEQRWMTSAAGFLCLWAKWQG